MKSFIIKLWHTLSRPAVHISLGVLTMGGFIAGVIFWGGFNSALETANTEEFCVSCHTMKDGVYQELQTTVHWKNHSGVRATCPDCHVPHNWTDKVARKMQASKEVFAEMFGNYDKPGEFENNRMRLAKHEWDRFSANKSLECKNCHNYNSMDFTKMSPTARIQMKQAAEKDQSCVDCHKGIAHKLPKGMDSIGGIVNDLEQLTSSTSYDVGSTLVSVRHLPVYFDAKGTKEAGLLNPASSVKVLDASDNMVKVEIDGWRKAKGFGRVIQEEFGKNIAVASLLKEASTSSDVVTPGEKKVDEITGLPWEKVSAIVWMKKTAMLNDVKPIWEKSREAYKTNCSVCHTQPDEAHFSANTWPGMFNGMMAFVNFDTDSEALVLKYLQKHSSDYAEGQH